MHSEIKHIAFIMDGNGRWAKARNLPRSLGHKAGCERVEEIYQECIDQGIEAMSLYAFSTENWKRPKSEIDQLFKYLNQFFKREINRMINKGVRIIVSGDITKLPLSTQRVVKNSVELTKNGKKFTFNICLNYGGKAEILKATKEIAEDYKKGLIIADEIDEKLFESHLYTKDLPPVDLMIRTSGEMRTSNYLPWQIAYAEMMFPLVPWPDFTKEEFRKCLEDFKNRDRRYGGIKDEK
ncbi:MAG: polyprenyl diphosphate synthase [Erysipelotrichaceae bacterium]|nr:polyprenyl diphosphate synthase [Erysipelotrichaceae bacterium]